MGHNPFGPQNRIATLFTGWLICQADGDYVFSSSSQDASFLLVDDKLVVDNGGLHPPQGDVSRQGNVTLKAGLHKLTFYHACTLGDPVAVAAWGTPARRDIIPIPQASFAPFEKATAGMMERYSQSVDVDFIPVHAGEYFMVDRYFQRYAFDALASGSAAKNIVWSWDFGDAQKSTAAKNEHVYLLPGKYTVTLAAKTPFGEIKRANQVFVSRPWDHVTENRLDTVKQHADIVAGYDFKGMDPAILAQAVLLLKRASHSDALMKAGAALVEQDKAPPEAISEVLPLYADALVARSKPDVAVEACLKAARMTPNPAVCAEMLVRAANITLEGKEDPNAALKLYQRVVKEYSPMTTHKSIREARIGVGDAYRFAGNYDLALKAYEEARVRSEDVMKKAAIMRGDFSRQVEDYLRRRDYDAAREALERWEETFPMDKLDGYWSLLRGRLLASEGSYEAAIREAEVLVRVNSGSNYAPELLMIAADSYRKLAKADKVTAVLQRIVKEYRDSPLAAEAAKKLKGK
jgi:tetratricopeptide (TPR) repeat protein